MLQSNLLFPPIVLYFTTLGNPIFCTHTQKKIQSTHILWNKYCPPLGAADSAIPMSFIGVGYISPPDTGLRKMGNGYCALLKGLLIKLFGVKDDVNGTVFLYNLERKIK